MFGDDNALAARRSGGSFGETSLDLTHREFHARCPNRGDAPCQPRTETSQANPICPLLPSFRRCEERSAAAIQQPHAPVPGYVVLDCRAETGSQ